MVLLFERNDITKVQVDAIVNAANNTLLGGGGVDGAIHRAAGPKLLEECRTLGGCETGDAKITKGYDLPAKYVIHTVGPIYRDGKHNEKEFLECCYESCLRVAKKNDIHSIAFPLISAGVFGYPKDEAIDVAVNSIKKFFENDDYDILVKIIFFGTRSTKLGEKKFGKIDEYIDDNYVKENFLPRQSQGYNALFGASTATGSRPSRSGKKLKAKMAKRSEPVMNDKMECYEMSSSLDEMIESLDESFSDSLLKIIDSKNLKDSEVYFKANMDRKLFSKIRNGSHPKKTTAVSLCVALELSLKETNDLLIKAGYVLNNSEKFDVIITYFLKNKIYDIYQINEALMYYDQPQLGVV